MGKYRKKPVVIEAFRFCGEGEPKIGLSMSNVQLLAWVRSHGGTGHAGGGSHFSVETLEGTMSANVGDWIIKGVAGE